MKDQIKYYAPTGTKNALQGLADQGESMSDVINRFVLPNIDLHIAKVDPRKPPSNVLKTRINDDEKDELTEYLNSDKSGGIKINKLLNTLLRNELGMKKLLTPIELNNLTEINKKLNQLNITFNSINASVREEGSHSFPKDISTQLSAAIDTVQDVGFSVESFKLKNGYKD
jgi:hypothetical protein